MEDKEILDRLSALETVLNTKIDDNSKTLTTEQRAYFWRKLASIATAAIALIGGTLWIYLVDRAEDVARETANTVLGEETLALQDNVHDQINHLEKQFGVKFREARLDVAESARNATAARIAKDILETEGFLQAATNKLAELIPNAVIMFDSGPDQPCPEGWALFEPAISRFAIGAAVSMKSMNDLDAKYRNDESGKPLSWREFGTTGGVEKHKLTTEEMPDHSHDLNVIKRKELAKHGDFSVIRSTTDPNFSDASSLPSGGGKAHENMPPFVALYYCRKD